MQFMMLMIPNVCKGNKKLEAGFVPLNAGARVSFGSGKPTVTDGPFVETKEVLK